MIRKYWNAARLWWSVRNVRRATRRKQVMHRERQRVEQRYGELDRIPLPVFLRELARALYLRIRYY